MSEEEYTDYSCSTAIERLSRDVETVLRTWHVDRGSDHHVTTIVSDSTSSGFVSRRLSSSASFAATTIGGDSDMSSIRVIRSNVLTWNMTLSTKNYGRCTVTIDLELALWDTPGGYVGNKRLLNNKPSSEICEGIEQSSVNARSMFRTSSTNSLLVDFEDEDEDGPQSSLVRSLRRRPFRKMPAHDFLFDNFSTLFGIGQHISLTPIQPHPLPRELLDSICDSILKRHDGDSTARWVLASTLSGWLQTALNIATANCHTCIPTFGVWGQYRPNELLLNIEEPTLPLEMNAFSVEGSLNSSDHPTLRKPLFPSKSTIVTGEHSSQSSRGERSVDRGVGRMGSRDLLVGRTIRTEKEKILDMQRKQSFAYSAGGLDRDAYKKKGGVQLFPQWAEAIQKVEIPPEFLLKSSRGAAVPNRLFSPPCVVGHVLTPRRTRNSAVPPFAASQMNRQDARKGVRKSSDGPAVEKRLTSYFGGANMWVSAFCTSTGANMSKNNVQPRNVAEVLAKSARLSVWAGVLLQHCPEDSIVVLTGARHVFGWRKGKNQAVHRSLFLRALDGSGGHQKGVDTTWRLGGDEDEYQHGLAAVHNVGDDEFELYRRQCQSHVQDILKEAWGCKDRKMPLWGPVDDPVASVYATTTWNGKTSVTNTRTQRNDPVVEPLLTFPLRIRSRRELSKNDWAEMEESVEKTILDPTTPSRFCVQAYYDRETRVSTLAANQRCILAALIRASTLPNETLLHHLTDSDLVRLWDDASGRQVARKIAERSGVGNGTKRIVDAMDWSMAVEELISVREAEYVVHDVMSGNLTAGFPSSPEDSFNEDDFLSAFRKSAPVGRLISTLFAHMARLRGLSSVALVWRVFCQELRRRWNFKESLPNMQYVPGLDPHPLELYEKRSFSTIGHKANFSAFLNCTEPDPDDFNCLIGQKLQVFNLGVECIIAGELLENEALEQFIGAGQVPVSLRLDEKKKKDPDVPIVAASVDGTTPECKSIEPSNVRRKKWPKSSLRNEADQNDMNYGPPTIDRDLDFWVMDEPGYAPTLDGVNFSADIADDTGFDYVAPPNDIENGDEDSLERALRKKSKKHKSGKGREFVVEGRPDQQWSGTVMDGNGSEESIVSSSTLSQAYFDAAEAGSIFSSKNGFIGLDTVVNVADMKRRPGARCPVANAVLNLSGDQLYAPYLHRPYPVTDDVALERRIMLAKCCEGEEKRGALKLRLDIAQRLQKPKLLSDMSAFKAANPHCTIDDFTKWYGNPGSPLDDYSDDPIYDRNYSLEASMKLSAARKLDKASEALRILVATRDFWGKTWEEAAPVAAAEQEPLFDFSTTVEMVLDYLEQLHPANLMNQVMAVNLSSAYFAIASSAKGTMKIGIVQLSMKRLRQKIERALELLSRDAAGMLSLIADNGSTAASTTTMSQFASEGSIAACEDACDALSVTETMVARATSLLHKLPGQYKLISDLLRFKDGSTLSLIDHAGRTSFLNLILEQQQRQAIVTDDVTMDNPFKDHLPNPILREYVFRNLDDDNPAQLAVRYGEEGSNLDGNTKTEGGVLLALMKSNMDDGAN